MAKAPSMKKNTRVIVKKTAPKGVATPASKSASVKSKSKAKSIVAKGSKPVVKKLTVVDPSAANKAIVSEAKVETPKRKVGRPKGSGKYGEPIKSVRMPISLAEQVDSYIARKGYVVPIYDTLVQAGFPSPAEDANCESLDLGEFLIPNPASTFFIRATGESMRDAGVFPNDVLIVDRSVEPVNGDVVVAAVNGDFTVKRLFKTGARVELRPENRKFRPICVTEDMDFSVWGVVKKVIHNV